MERSCLLGAQFFQAVTESLESFLQGLKSFSDAFPVLDALNNLAPAFPGSYEVIQVHLNGGEIHVLSLIHI